MVQSLTLKYIVYVDLSEQFRRSLFVLQSSVSPSYTHLILLHVGSGCNPSSALEFEVFSVNESQLLDSSLDKSCKLNLPRDISSSVVS